MTFLRQQWRNLLLALGMLAVLLILATWLRHGPLGPGGFGAAAPPTEQLRYLPENTKVVVSLNAAALPENDRTAWGKLGERLYRMHLTPGLKDNMPAIHDVTSITLGIPAVGWPGGTILIRGQVDSDHLAKQLQQAAGWKSEVEDAVRIFHRKASDQGLNFPLPEPVKSLLDSQFIGSDIYLAALDENTVILRINPSFGFLNILNGNRPARTDLRDALQARPRASKPRISSALLTVLEKQDGRAWLSCAVIMDNALDPRLSLFIPKEQTRPFEICKHVVASVREDNNIETTLVATGRDVDSAREMETNLKENARIMLEVMPRLSEVPHQKAVLTDIARSIQVNRKDAVVTASAKIPAQQARQLFAPVAGTIDKSADAATQLVISPAQSGFGWVKFLLVGGGGLLALMLLFQVRSWRKRRSLS